MCWEVPVMNRRSYLDALLGQIHCRRACPMIEEELQGHIDEQKRDFMADGMTEQEAEEAAVLEMGDPVEVGKQLDKIHRPKMPYLLIGFIIGLSGIGVAIQIAINKLIELGDVSGISASYVQDMFVGMGIGIIMMLVICYMDYRIIGKYAMHLWAALNILLVLQRFMGVMINGSVRVGIVLYMLLPAFAAVLYHYKGKGRRGLFKCLACYMLSILLSCWAGWSIMYTLVLYVAGAILIFAAAKKQWFGRDRVKQTTMAAGLVLGLMAVLALVGIGVYYFGADYQRGRMDAMVQMSGNFPGYIYIANALESISQVMNQNTNIMIPEDQALALTSIRSDYILAFTFKCLGSWQGIFVVALVAGFIALLCVLVHRQKNPLGYILSLSVLLMMGIEIVVYLGANFGYLPGTALAMPFFTGGKVNMFVTYIYMGLMLSIYRNQNLIPAR